MPLSEFLQERVRNCVVHVVVGVFRTFFIGRQSLLRLLNVSIPFSLYTSFDYLGFWLYALFGLIVAGPLSRQSLIAKITAASLALFGVLFHCLMGALLAGQLASSDIEIPFLIVFALLLVPVTLMMFAFKQRM